MENKHKNILIGVLLAVILVMAVGYAAFAQTLTINGSAEISSTWDVHMTQDNTKVTPTAGNASATAPSGSVTVGAGGTGATGTTATFTVSLVSPGDQVSFAVPIVNTGTIDARLNNIQLSSTTPGMQIEDTVATTQSGNIRFTVTSPGTAVLNNTAGSATVTVVAEYVDIVGGNTNANQETANLTVTMDYVQA